MTKDPPASLVCPLTRQLVEDPVRSVYGVLYDRQALTQHVRRYHTCPTTHKPLDFHLIFPDLQARKNLEKLHIEQPAEANSEEIIRSSADNAEAEPVAQTPGVRRFISTKPRPVSERPSRKLRSLSSPMRELDHSTSPASDPSCSPDLSPSVSQKKDRVPAFTGSSSYGRTLLSPKASRTSLLGPSSNLRMKSVDIPPPTARWARGGRSHRWKFFSDNDNALLETAFGNGEKEVRLARNLFADVQERTLISTQGSSKRELRRGTYFFASRSSKRGTDGEDWTPLREDLAEMIEYSYVNALWNAPIHTKDKRYFFIIKTDVDIRRYDNPTTDESDFVPVLRGFNDSLLPSPRKRKLRFSRG